MRANRLICATLCLMFSLAQAQTTSLRQSRIYVGDIAELTIEYDATMGRKLLVLSAVYGPE